MTPGRALDTHAARDDDAAIRRLDPPDSGRDSALSAAASTGAVTGLSAASLSRLQRAAGNRTVSRAIAVQRHEEGKELPTVDEDVTEASEKAAEPEPTGDVGEPSTNGDGAAPPAETPAADTGTPVTETGAPSAEATAPAEEVPAEPVGSTEAEPAAARSKKVEKAEKKAGKAAAKSFKKDQKLNPGAMSLAAAEKILQGQFGGLKKIVPGTIVILADQPACSAK